MAFSVVKREEYIKSNDLVSENNIFLGNYFEDCKNYILDEVTRFDVFGESGAHGYWWARKNLSVIKSMYYIADK